MTARALFVTGTDTGVGKTVVAAALLRGLVACGVRAAGFKPVAAGNAPGAADNADVIALRAAGNVTATAAQTNPYAFAAPIAPHLAAAHEGRRIELGVVRAAFAALAARADAVVIEGAGGARVPLDGSRDMLDLAVDLAAPVLLVVGIRLGCLNHALLTAQAVRERGLTLAGWVATRLEPGMPFAQENVDDLRRRLRAPLAGDFAAPGHARFDTETLATLGLLADA